VAIFLQVFTDYFGVLEYVYLPIHQAPEHLLSVSEVNLDPIAH